MEDKLSLIKYFKETRQITENLCQPLQLEDYLSQPIENVSPPKWHLGHTTWFFEALILKSYNKGYKVFNEEYFYLFNSYYNTLGERTSRGERRNQTRPTIKQVFEYRSYIDYEMVKFLESDYKAEVDAIIELGINHEKQHQELLITDIKYILYQNISRPKYNDLNNKLFTTNEINNDYHNVEEGIYEIGYDGPDFHFDNEEGVHRVFLESFQINQKVVTNDEYLEFVKSGAYDDFRHWLSDGWTWINENNVKAPLYWEEKDKEWFYFTLSGMRKIDLKAPVTHISFYEADAYATWAQKRLLAEFEWESAFSQIAGNIKPVNYLETGNYAPTSERETFQLLGNVWEWTNSAYLAYPFFKLPKGPTAEYNGKFMANQMVLRGGSCATPKSQIRPTYRNFFYLHERWQFTGLRLALQH